MKVKLYEDFDLRVPAKFVRMRAVLARSALFARRAIVTIHCVSRVLRSSAYGLSHNKPLAMASDLTRHLLDKLFAARSVHY